MGCWSLRALVWKRPNSASAGGWWYCIAGAPADARAVAEYLKQAVVVVAHVAHSSRPPRKVNNVILRRACVRETALDDFLWRPRVVLSSS